MLSRLLRRAIYGIFLALVAFGTATAAPDDVLDAYRWKARVLLLLASDLHDRRLSDQLARLGAAEAGVRERQIVVLTARQNGTVSEQGGAELGRLPDRWHQEDGFQVVLIGKDGGAKARWSEPVDPSRIFAEIDQMPMRRSEMRR